MTTPDFFFAIENGEHPTPRQAAELLAQIIDCAPPKPTKQEPPPLCGPCRYRSHVRFAEGRLKCGMKLAMSVMATHMKSRIAAVIAGAQRLQKASKEVAATTLTTQPSKRAHWLHGIAGQKGASND